MSISNQTSNEKLEGITERVNSDDDAQSKLGAKGKKVGRPRKSKEEKYKSTHIMLHPKVIEWAKAEAKRRGIGYQSVINETLLEHVG